MANNLFFKQLAVYSQLRITKAPFQAKFFSKLSLSLFLALLRTNKKEKILIHFINIYAADDLIPTFFRSLLHETNQNIASESSDEWNENPCHSMEFFPSSKRNFSIEIVGWLGLLRSEWELY